MNYRDTYEYRLYEALSNVLDHTSNYDGIPCEIKEEAEKLMDEWASDRIADCSHCPTRRTRRKFTEGTTKPFGYRLNCYKSELVTWAILVLKFFDQ